MTTKPTILSQSPYQEKTYVNWRGLVLLIIAGGLSFALLISPLAVTKTDKFLFMVAPATAIFLILIINFDLGLKIWLPALTVLVTQTGYQLDIGQVRTSALEAMILIALPVIALRYRHRSGFNLPHLRLPGLRAYIAFALFAGAMFTVALLRGVSIELALFQFKGFLLYPLMAYLFLAGVRSRNELYLNAGIMIIWFLFLSVQSYFAYFLNTGTSFTLTSSSVDSQYNITRFNPNFAAINVYGISSTAIALAIVGWSLHAKQRLVKAMGISLAGFIFMAGAIASVSRTVWVAVALCLLYALFSSKIGKSFIVSLLITAFITLLILLPSGIQGRLLQLSDSSTVKREAFIDTGIQALQESWFLGWGWGQGFWLSPAGSLIAVDWVPWFHNDYLNLAVQVGLVGLIIYLIYWAITILAATRWLRQLRGPTHYSGFVLGSQLGLIVLLFSALTEHVLWRTDSAGLIGWFLGMMVVSMQLDKNIQEYTHVKT